MTTLNSVPNGLLSTVDATGTLNIQTNSVNALAIDTNQNATMNYVSAQNTFGFKNRVINGAMVIDQRNAGASVTLTSSAPYIVDRFFGYKDTSGATVTGQRSTTSTAGFSNSLAITVFTGSNAGSTDQNMIQQGIEGFNVADLNWGTANAKTVTLSFWVNSSLTGTYGLCLSNSAGNRCYVASYVINSANTWEQKSVTIAGDTTGTWVTDNGMGIRLRFDYGSGSNYQGTAGVWGSTFYNTVSGRANLIGTTGATFYITGVQLEKGSIATPFDYRDFARELMMCQRYYETSFDYGTAPSNGAAGAFSTNNGLWGGYSSNGFPFGAFVAYKVSKRLAASVTAYGNSSGYWWANGGFGVNAFAPTGAGTQGVTIGQQQVGGLTLTAGHWADNAEL
jgi:hypothetical protein